MNLLYFLIPTSPANYKPIPSFFFPILTVLCTFSSLLFSAKLLAPHLRHNEQTAKLFFPSSNCTFIRQFHLHPQTFSDIGAVHLIQNDILVSDHPSNHVYYLSQKAPVTLPFLANAGGQNETHAANLLRPGVSSVSQLKYVDNTRTLVITQHASRSLSILRIYDGEDTDFAPHYEAPRTIVESYNQSQLNAPYALCTDEYGNLFFADSYFGLIEQYDEFQRELDHPVGESSPQRVYYIPSAELDNAVRAHENGSAVTLEPVLLVDNLDRPSGIAVRNGQLYLALASARRASLLQYTLQLEKESGVLQATDRAEIYNWKHALHNWEQAWYTGILGNMVMDEGNRLYVAAADGVAMFDMSNGALNRGRREVMSWISTQLPPGPPTLAYDNGVLTIGMSTRVVSMSVL